VERKKKGKKKTGLLTFRLFSLVIDSVSQHVFVGYSLVAYAPMFSNCAPVDMHLATTGAAAALTPSFSAAFLRAI